LSNVRLRNSVDRKLIALLSGDLPIFDLAFSPDGRWLAAAQHQGKTTLWDLTRPTSPSPVSIQLPESNIKTHIWRVAFSPDSSLLAAGSSDGALTVRNISTLQPVKTFHLPRAVSALSFSTDGKTLAAGGLDATVWLFSMEPK
jgi:WD40 repeat protein